MASSNPGFLGGSQNGNPANAMEFFLRRALARMPSATIVKVVAVYSEDGIAPAGVVDVQPLVNQVSGDGTITVRPVVYGVPFCRVQSGSNAIIMDPDVGDIGVCCFADRDLSAVIANQDQAPPGSARHHSMSDALYVCSILGKETPTQYVVFDESGIKMVSPTLVTIEAPTTAVQGNLTVSGTVIADGEVTGNGIPLSTHLTTGVQEGSGTSGPPVA